MEEGFNLEKRKTNLRLSIWDAVFAALNTGCGETYISPFAIALHATNIQIGLLNSLPNLAAALVQLRTPSVMRRLGSRKKVITPFVCLQALLWVPILFIPFVTWEAMRVIGLIFFYTLYLSLGSFSLPAWGSLMSDSVSEGERGRYFGLRSKILGGVTVLSGFLAGYWLHLFSGRPFMGFAFIFGTAAFARFVSGYFVSRLHDPYLHLSREHHFSFLEFVRGLPRSNFARYVFAIGAFHFAAYMAGPYFAVLMLRDFGFSYLTYTVLITTASVSSLLGVTYWGRHADEFGNLRLIKLSSCLIAFIPLLWLVSHNVWYLLLVQGMAGYLWGGFNLCIANFIYDSAIPEKRAYCISYYNVVNGIGLFLGTMLGGFLSGCLPAVMGYAIFGLLILSSLARMVVAFFLLPRIREVRHVKEIAPRDLFLRIAGLGPSLGMAQPSDLSFRGDK